MKGKIVLWEIPSLFRTTSEKLIELGIEESTLPENAHKTVLKKAVDIVKRDLEVAVGMAKTEKAYRKRAPKIEGTNKHGFVLLIPDKNEAGGYDPKNALEVFVDTETGVLEFKQWDSSDDVFESLCRKVRENYVSEKGTIDNTQFAEIVTGLVTKKRCNGFSLKRKGGSYFVDQRFFEKLELVEQLFAAHPSAQLHAWDIEASENNMAKIELGASTSFLVEIESFKIKLEKLAKSGLKQRRFDGLGTELKRIESRFKQHKDNLRSQYEKVSSKADELFQVMKSEYANAEGNILFDLGAALQKLNEPEPVKGATKEIEEPKIVAEPDDLIEPEMTEAEIAEAMSANIEGKEKE